jgi:NAD(P)-dependent dehydrogenase (short-subunit alcohol dehydrogenase family)
MATTLRRAVVTGGGRGIGRACAAALSAAGHHVAILGRKEAPLKDAVATGEAAEYHLVDVTDEASLTGCLNGLGAIDILVNNAGIADSAPIAKTDVAFFRRLMAVNFESAVIAIRAVLPGMVERDFGRIISIASIAGLKGIPYASAYVASKHAIVGLTRSLALEVARTGVTVNAVCPGYVDTDLVTEGAARVAGATGRPVDEIKRSFYRGNPQQRLITAEEVGEAVLWLSGDLAASVNGQAIAISGGEV